MGETHEAPQDHTLVDFKPHPGYTTEGQTFSCVPVPNAPRGTQYQSPPQPLHFVRGGGPLAIIEKEKFDHIEERLRAIEGGGNYAFADMAELCLVPDVVIPPKLKVPDFSKYKGTTCPENHLKIYCRKMGAYAKDEKLLMHFFQETLVGAAIT